MGERSTGRRGPATPWGLLGMVVLVVLFERGVANRDLHVLDIDDWVRERNARWASREGRGCQVVCFGDSLVKYGVAPRAVAERSGRSAYNLAIPGGQPAASYALLRRLLDSGARPEAVVLDVFPVLLRDPPGRDAARWVPLFSAAEAAEFAWRAGDPAVFGAVTAARLLPSVRARAGVRACVVAALAGKADGRFWVSHPFFRNWTANLGAQMMAATGVVRTLPADKVEVLRRAFFADASCLPVHAQYVGKFLGLAAARGVTVYWVLPPVAPVLRAAASRGGFDAAHEAFLRGWAGRFPNLVVVDGRDAVADPDAYFDHCHLARPGAYAFSLALGDALRRDLPARAAGTPPPPRWVSLPPAPTRPVPDAVEDFEASRLAVLAAGRSRR